MGSVWIQAESETCRSGYSDEPNCPCDGLSIKSCGFAWFFFGVSPSAINSNNQSTSNFKLQNFPKPNTSFAKMGAAVITECEHLSRPSFENT